MKKFKLHEMACQMAADGITWALICQHCGADYLYHSFDMQMCPLKRLSFEDMPHRCYSKTKKFEIDSKAEKIVGAMLRVML